MENRIRGVLLVAGLVSGLLLNTAYAQDAEDGGLLEPQLERAEVFDGSIGSHDLVVSAYAGVLGVEDFDANSVTGLELAFQVTERFFIQYVTATSQVGETSFEVLSGSAPLLTDSERDVEYYLVNLGFNVLPGESFVTSGTTLNTAFFVTAGVGSVTFGGDDRSATSIGFGNRVKFNDWMGMSVEMRYLQWEMDLFGEVKNTGNLEGTLAFSLFF